MGAGPTEMGYGQKVIVQLQMRSLTTKSIIINYVSGQVNIYVENYNGKE